jgi:hypothetical protein
LREDDFAELAVNFGEKAASLAKLFGSIQRPKTLETPKSLDDNEATILLRDDNGTLTIPRYAFDELRIMEAANLYDQKSLKSEKFPTLCNLWGASNDKDDKNDEFD